MILKLIVPGVLDGVMLGTMLVLMRLPYSKLLSNVAGSYINYPRLVPLLLVTIWFYFAVPFILRWVTSEDALVGAFTSYLVVFMMFGAAYHCEIVRVGIQTIPKGQTGAAQALGMTCRQTMRLVTPLQAFHKMAPLLLQRSIILLQGISLVYIVGLMDFLNSACSCSDIIGQTDKFLIFADLVYFIVSFTASFAVRHLQRRLTA